MRRDYLITGHPRSGTGYMAQLFTANGYEVGHEVVDRHGTSNWQMLVKAYDYPFPGDPFVRQDIQFAHHWHLLRYPLHIVCSVAFTERRSEWFRAQYVNLYGNEFEKAIQSVWGWNQIAQSQLAWPVIMERAAALFGFEDIDPVNTREHDQLTERELQSLVSRENWNLYLVLKHDYESIILDDNCYCDFLKPVRPAGTDAGLVSGPESMAD